MQSVAQILRKKKKKNHQFILSSAEIFIKYAKC